MERGPVSTPSSAPLLAIVAVFVGIAWFAFPGALGHAKAWAHREVHPTTDPWRDYLAPSDTCPGSDDASAPEPVQAHVALCLLDYAREKRGLPPLTEAPPVSEWSKQKALDIFRCNEFSHEPCGEASEAHARASGYRGAFGENIYVGEGHWATPRAAVDAWLNSPHHRENLFDPQWATQGIAILRVDRVGDYREAAVWVSEFGD